MRTPILRALALALLTTLVATAGAGAAAAPSPSATTATNRMQDILVRGTVEGDRTFRGRLDIVRFRAIEGQLYAVGDLSGRIIRENGTVLGRITDQRIRLPLTIAGAPTAAAVSPAGSTCEILDLRLGPLDLNLLGLNVHLERIVLVITAEPGPGNLLGNLLCAITGLLDSGLPLNQVLAQLLNVVRGLLNLFG